MKPINKIRREIILLACSNHGWPVPDELDTDEQVEEVYDNDPSGYADVAYDFRGGQVQTNLPTPYSRHYEAKSVAAQCRDGSWVGWTYWYGGGKHGNPQEIEWMRDAYDLTCTEQEKVIIERVFTKV